MFKVFSHSFISPFKHKMICATINRSFSMISTITRFAIKNNRLVQNGTNSTQINFHRSYSNIDVKNWIETLSESEKEKLRFIQNEIQLLELEKKNGPQLAKLSVKDYLDMLAMSNNKRHKYYNYLHSVHWVTTAQNTKKDLKLKLAQIYAKGEKPKSEDLDAKYREYGLGKNNYLPRIYNKTIDAMKNRNVFRQIILNGPKIVFDLDFDNEMSPRENTEAAKQLTRIMGDNRNHRLPYVMHFCNARDGNVLARHMHNMIPNLHKQPLFIHKEDYLDVFPKDKIVLLTPDSPNVLDKYNPDDHYVISAIVDRGDMKPLTLSKAKRFDLHTARLPLEKYRSVRQNRVLTLDQIFNVLLDVKMFGNWDRAFNHVAARKFK